MFNLRYFFDFFLWGYVKGLVYVPPLLASLLELKQSYPRYAAACLVGAGVPDGVPEYRM